MDDERRNRIIESVELAGLSSDIGIIIANYVRELEIRDVVPRQVKASTGMALASNALEEYKDYDIVCEAAIWKLLHDFRHHHDDFNATLLGRILDCVDRYPENAGVQQWSLSVFFVLSKSWRRLSREQLSTVCSLHCIQSICHVLENFHANADIQYEGCYLLYKISFRHFFPGSGLCLDFFIQQIQWNVLSLAVSAIELFANKYAAYLMCHILRGKDFGNGDRLILHEHIRTGPNILSILQRLRVVKERIKAEGKMHPLKMSWISSSIKHLARIVGEQ